MVSKVERLQKQYEENLEKAKIAKAELVKLRREQERKDKASARKARNRVLFQVGGLVELAGLLDCDKGALLGGLLTVAKTLEDGPESARFQEWKQSGDALLAERKATAQKTAETEIPVSESVDVYPVQDQP
ncbi:conjugal transfer protein TraD [Acidithiobacillus thiooxidans]|uniref:Conjugal transfer protein TraD n=1 Tax=Acidithiobacillus thiooxidans ATCC 19377 TaxID=637390 RepID=A0A543PYN3_ACITH|nr:conjugal transfer protein TraD [Acidithiobacillus thiooxidans]MDX5936768.1 conjugal transfer protein TraD [Acidithiobacillus thiooxidans]MDX5936780.1 conjugal transfer protein TraD [Acidithiobacillus thiooxidans]TQN49179.1 hypothetical protein DLNHIDIE_03497 [Acidithiobacillus thiooxidans ATCC 19377]